MCRDFHSVHVTPEVFIPFPLSLQERRGCANNSLFSILLGKCCFVPPLLPAALHLQLIVNGHPYFQIIKSAIRQPVVPKDCCNGWLQCIVPLLLLVSSKRSQPNEFQGTKPLYFTSRSDGYEQEVLRSVTHKGGFYSL